MGCLVISPVGTSLLANFVSASRSGCSYCAEVVEVFKDRGVEEWARLGLDDDRNRFPDGLLCSFVKGTPVFDALLRFVRDYGSRSCAELSGLSAIVSSYLLDPRETTVLLLPTRTCNSMLCARVLEEFLRESYRGVEVVPLRMVGSEDDFEEFAIEVLDRVVKRVVDERRRGVRVFVNASPGFKAEVSFLVLASILGGASAVVYIHEAFRKGVSLPIPPIAIDREYVSKLLGVFGDRQCIDKGEATAALSDEELAVARDRGVIYERKGLVCLRKWVRKLLELG